MPAKMKCPKCSAEGDENFKGPRLAIGIDHYKCRRCGFVSFITRTGRGGCGQQLEHWNTPRPAQVRRPTSKTGTE